MTSETPNRVAHVHHYVLKGSGLSCWAECDVVIGDGLSFDFITRTTERVLRCREKLAGDNGPIVGSRTKVESAMQA